MLPSRPVLPLTIALASTFFLFSQAGTAAASWLNADWEFRAPMTADPALIEGAGPLNDFTMLVSLNGVDNAHVFANAKPDGSDLLFTEADGVTVLSRELVSYDALAETAEIWVMANELSDANNVFYIYYSNPDSSLANTPGAAWNPDYRAVYHFADDPGAGTLTDSSPAGANAPLDPARWQSDDVKPGKIDQAFTFDGTDNWISTTSISSQDSSYVVSAWLEHTAGGTDFFVQTNPGFWHTSSQTTSGRPNFASVEAAGSWAPNPIPLNDGFHHFLWVLDGVNDDVYFYYDGVQQNLLGMTPGVDALYTGFQLNPNNDQPVGIVGPMFPIQDDFMNGAGDEFRVHQGVLSPEWIKTEFNNQDAPSVFFTFGGHEVITAVGPGDAVAGSILSFKSHPNPFSHSSSVRFGLSRPSRVHLAVYDVAGRRVRTLLDASLPAGSFERSWDGRNQSGRPVASGVYFLRLDTERSHRSLKSLLVR